LSLTIRQKNREHCFIASNRDTKLPAIIEHRKGEINVLAYVAKPGDTKWDNYKDWFENRINTIYKTTDGGWPWTQLGYTCDWGNPRNYVGLSEFVIRLDPDQILLPEQKNPFVIVKIERGVDSKIPGEWERYFRCRSELRQDDPATFPSCPEDLSN
jgi:hypothetical protein